MAQLRDDLRQRPAARAGGRGGDGSHRVTESHRETYVHSSVVFLKDGRLQSGRVSRHNATLLILPKPPPHADKATLSWRLVTTVDLAGARDIKARRLVKVTA